MASWTSEPLAVSGEWTCFRQVSPEWPPLFHNAGEPVPSQESGRWHREGEGYAQYLALTAPGAWAEYARFIGLRSPTLAREVRRNLWVVLVRERDIADLDGFEKYEACGLDPRMAVHKHHTATQALADDLRAAGFRGVLSPSASLPYVTNLTLFGERYEKVLLTDPRVWPNPDPDSWLPCQPAVERGPLLSALCSETVFRDKQHESYRAWLTSQGRALPSAPP